MYVPMMPQALPFVFLRVTMTPFATPPSNTMRELMSYPRSSSTLTTKATSPRRVVSTRAGGRDGLS